MITSTHSRKTIIYLAELAHDGFGLSLRTFPLGLGVVGSFAKLKFPEVHVRLFRTYKDLIEAVSEQKPDIVGFGYFSWNDYLTLVASRAIRQLCPDALIIFGGSNISPYGQEKSSGFPSNQIAASISTSNPNNADDQRYKWPVYNDYQLLASYDNVDVIVHGDGELPMADLIGQFLDVGNREKVKEAAVAGCSALVSGTVIRGPAPEVLYDLDRIPSPYSSGIFDEFMQRFNLLPQIETVRGCPYKCTFCTIGLNEGKLRRHSLAYSKEEILYLKDNYSSRILRIADPNWGMLKKDIELAEFLHKLRNETGYPSSLRVYYSAGGPFENIKSMAFLMREVLPLNMSFQSLNVDTLKTIKRGNMALSKVAEMVSFARTNRIATSTELISGLPKESPSSFKNSFLSAVKLRLDSIYTASLYLIKGSELYTPEAREKYRFKTKFALVERDVTQVDGRWVFEMDEIVVEHTEMTQDDFFDLYQFKLWGMVVYGAAYLKEIIMHCDVYGVTLLDIYDELIDGSSRYPFHKALFNGYIDSIKPLFFDKPEDLEANLVQHIEKFGNVDRFYWYRHTQLAMASVLGPNNKVTFVDEVAAAAKRAYKRKRSSMVDPHGADAKQFELMLEELRKIQPICIISPLQVNDRVIEVPLDFDIKAWADDNYQKPLSEYGLPSKRVFAFIVRNIEEHINFLRDTQPFKSDEEKYEYFYSVMVSSNMRRFITYGDAQTTCA